MLLNPGFDCVLLYTHTHTFCSSFSENRQRSYLHVLTTPNRLVRLSEDGGVLYSSRLTVKAKCQMDLHRFPLDVQVLHYRFDRK